MAQHIFLCVSKQTNEEGIRDFNTHGRMVQLLSLIRPFKDVINAPRRRQAPRINQGLQRIWFLFNLLFWLTCYKQSTSRRLFSPFSLSLCSSTHTRKEQFITRHRQIENASGFIHDGNSAIWGTFFFRSYLQSISRTTRQDWKEEIAIVDIVGLLTRRERERVCVWGENVHEHVPWTL